MEVRSIVQSKKQKLWLAESVDKFHTSLGDPSSPAGREYFHARGITDEMIDRWKLGYVVDGQYSGRVSIPYWTPAGYSAMVFRCTHLPGEPCKDIEHHSKYLATPGYRPMFNVRALSVGADRVGICEGELDAIVATSNGLPTVSLGTNARWEDHFSYCFDGPREVLPLVDGDEAGKKLVGKVQSNLHTHVRPIYFPSGSDVSSYVLEHGPDAFRSLVEGE
jgi:DNA primase